MAGGEEEGAPLTQGSPLLRGANQGRFTGWGPKVGARGVRKRGVDCERCFRSLGRVAQESLLRSSFGAMALCLTLLLDLVPLHSSDERLTAEEMDEQRRQNVAYQYLCRLEEAKR